MIKKALDWFVAISNELTPARFRMVGAASAGSTAVIIAIALTGTNSLELAAALLSRGLPAGEPVAEAPAPAPSEPPAPAPRPAPGPPATGPSAPVSTPPAETPTAPVEDEEDDREPGRVKHVWLVSLSSPGYEKAFGETSEMPYLAQTLRPQGHLLSGYSLISAKGLPNYIAAISGQRPNPKTVQDCPSYDLFPPTAAPNSKGFVSGAGCLYTLQTTSLADQLQAENLSWRGYMEDMGNPDSPDPQTPPIAPVRPTCVRPMVDQPDPTQHSRSGNGYAIRHNPFVYFRSLTDIGGCGQNVVPLDRLEAELANPAQTPAFSFISPNLCHAGSEIPCLDGTPGGAGAADDWLEAWIPKILASTAYKRDGLVVITFGETSLPQPAPNERVGTLLLSRWAAPGSELPTPNSPYSLLKTIEDLFGLDYLAAAGLKSTPSFAGPLLGSKAPAGKLIKQLRATLAP